MEKLQKCIEQKSIHTSRSREVIYKILLGNARCLSVLEILELAHEAYPIKISLNTLYRHLKLFIECDLIITVQNDLKKSYYCYKTSDEMCFTICPVCNTVARLHINNNELPDSFKQCSIVSVHKKCKQCI